MFVLRSSMLPKRKRIVFSFVLTPPGMRLRKRNRTIRAYRVCRNEGKMVKVKVDVTKIVKYVCVTGVSIVAIIFGAKCLRAYLEDEE